MKNTDALRFGLCNLRHRCTLVLLTAELLPKAAVSELQWSRFFIEILPKRNKELLSTNVASAVNIKRETLFWPSASCLLHLPQIYPKWIFYWPIWISSLQLFHNSLILHSIMECVCTGRRQKCEGKKKEVAPHADCALLASQLSLLEQWWKQVGQSKKNKTETLLDDADKYVSTLTLTSRVSPVAYIFPHSLVSAGKGTASQYLEREVPFFVVAAGD